MSHKAGFVNIIGNPNVGKSTLMNAMVGERISIITSKAQTTRQRVFGIVNDENYQIVYSDTPGILKPKYLLQESMLRFVENAFADADILLYVTEKYDQEPDEHFLKLVNSVKVPVILVINKIDLCSEEELEHLQEKWQQTIPSCTVIKVSALNNIYTDSLLQQLLDILPEHEAYFPKDELTDKPMRFFMSEIIREKILLNYKKEIPYCTEVIIESYKEEEDIVRIRAEIMVARDSQKGILIGHKGEALKKVGIKAREDMEEFLGKKVYLEMYVKVDKNWRNNQNQLRRYGYVV